MDVHGYMIWESLYNMIFYCLLYWFRKLKTKTNKNRYFKNLNHQNSIADLLASSLFKLSESHLTLES